MALLPSAVKAGMKRLGLYEPARRLWFSVSRPPWWEMEQVQRRLYRSLVYKGDLCFDIGGNEGEKTAVFRRLGARVVVVEPQPPCIERLRRRFASDTGVEVVGSAVGDRAGEAKMMCSAASTQTGSLSAQWVERVKESGRLPGREWETQIVVPVTTLDLLIARYGEPAFCKIDVEGYEPQVLAGLSTPIRALSFEYTPECPEPSTHCIHRLCDLGRYEFNYAVMDEDNLKLSAWVKAEEMVTILQSIADGRGGEPKGDIYARRL